MYQIALIEISEPINTHSRKPWFRYVISNERNTITGYRCGSESEVRRFARECIKSLNLKYPTGKQHHVNPVQINTNQF